MATSHNGLKTKFTVTTAKDRYKNEDLSKYLEMYNSGYTASGRTVSEALGIPKSGKNQYSDFLNKSNAILRGDTTDEAKTHKAIQAAHKNAFYAKNWITQNASKYDADGGEGSSQRMLDYIDQQIKQLDSIDGRNLRNGIKAQQEATQKDYAKKKARWDAMNGGEQADPNKITQQAMDIIRQQNAGGGSAVSKGHGGKSGYFGEVAVEPAQTAPVQTQKNKPVFRTAEEAAAYYGISPELKKKLDAEALEKSRSGSDQPVIRANQTQSAGITDQKMEMPDQLRKQQQAVAAKMKGDSLNTLRTAKQNQTLTLDQIGRYGKGNVDLYNRPVVYNDDGTYSSLYSVSFEDDDGKEVLVPSIALDAQGKPKKLTAEEAWNHYKQTGEYLGKFDTPEEADAYAEKIHSASDNSYGAEIEKNHPAQVNYAPKQNNPFDATPTEEEVRSGLPSRATNPLQEINGETLAEALKETPALQKQEQTKTVTQAAKTANGSGSGNVLQNVGDAVGTAASSVWDFVKNSAAEMGKAAFDMTVGTVFNTTWDQMQEEDKDSKKTGVGFKETLKDFLLSAGGQFNSSVLGTYASAVDITQSALKNLIGLKTSRNYARDLQTANMENLTKAIKPMIENGTWLENIAMNTMATALNSFALMVPGTALASKVGAAMGGGIGTVNTMIRENKIAFAGNVAQMAPFAIQDASDNYEQARANGANEWQAAASGLLSGLMGLATNSKAYEDYGEKLGLGVATNPKLLAGVSSAYMGANWGESAVTWFKDALTSMGMAEGLQEVSESLAIKLNDDMWNGSIFDANKWQNWAQNVKQDFMYGYLSGALFYVTALPAYAPSRQMLTGMIEGDTETTPEQIGTFIAQVAEDTQDQNLKPNAQAALEDANKAEAIAGKVTAGEPLQQARQEATAEQITAAKERQDSAAEDQNRALLQTAQEAVQQKYAEPEQDTETGTMTETQNSPTETAEALPEQVQTRRATEAAGQSVVQPLAVQSEERAAQTKTSREQNGEQAGSAMDAEAQVQNETGTANVTVKNIRAVENGTVYFNVEDEDGETGVARADDVRFADDQTNDLISALRAKNMTAQTVNQYLKYYVSKLGAAEEYARAFEGVFNRARIGMSYDEAALKSLPAQKYMTDDARIVAYTAGKANAVVVRKGFAEAAPVKAGRYGLVRAYTQEAYAKIGDANARRQAGMELNALQALAEKYKVKMRVTESLDMTDANGKVTRKSGANGKYDPKTGEITIALDAMDHAYLYVGMHELTHLLMTEKPEQWDDFVLYVADILDKSGQDMNAMVKEQMKRGNMDSETAVEEVVANTTPALLKDEENLRELLNTNRSLFQTVTGWLKEFVEGVKEIGSRLAARAGWAQLNNLKDDTETLHSIWAQMKKMLEDHSQTETQKEGPESYSIKTLQDGKQYVEADREVITGNDPAQWRRQIIRYINETIRGGKDVTVYGADGDALTITKNTAGKAAFLNDVRMQDGKSRPMNKAEFEGKLHAEAHIDELAEVSHRGNQIVPDNKNHPFARNGFNYRTAYFLDGDKWYKLTISVGINGTVNSIYNIGKMKETASSITSVKAPRGSKAKSSDTVSDGIISQEGKNVNENADGSGENKNRYSEKEEGETISGSDVEVITLNREHQEAERAGEALQNAFEATAGHRISAAEADRLAEYVLKESNSQYDRDKLAQRVAEVYTLAEGGADTETVQTAQYDLMKDVMAGSRTLMTEHEERAKPIREMLRNTPVSLSDAQWAEAANQMDSVGAYRRALFGKVRITRSAPQTLDQAWEEWSVTAPEYFPPNTSETDMPRLLVEVVDALKPVYQNEYGFNMEEGAQYLAMQMNGAYLKLPGVKAAAKEQKRLGLADEQYRQAMTAYRDQSREQFDAALKEIRGAQEKQKQTEQQQRTAAMKKKYATWRAADMESRRATELREKIRTVGLDLSTRLTQPKGEKYIPEALLGSVAKTCDAVVNAMQTAKGADTRIGERINGLITQLDAMKHVQDADYASEDYEGLNGMAQSLADEIGEKSIREMTYGQLAKVYNLLKGIQTTVQNAKKLIGRKEAITTYQAGTQTMRELNAARGFKDTPLGRLQDLYVESMLGAIRFFRRATGYTQDSTLVKLAEELNDGQRKSIEITRQGKALFAGFVDTPEKRAWMKKMQGAKAEWVDMGLKDVNGKAVPVTRAMVVSLWLHSQNAENMKHLVNGGMIVPEQKAYQRGDIRQAYANGTKVAGLTQEAIAQITDTMTTEESALATATSGFFNGFTKKFVNEASLLLNGYRKATVDSYYPIRTDSNYLVSNFDISTGEATAASLVNPGWLVERKQARQPIYLEDVVNVIERQLDGVSKYAGMAVPMRNFGKVWNTTLTGYADSVKSAMARKWGVRGMNYVNNLMKDVAGARKQPNRLFGQLKGNFAKAALTMNVSVALKQAASYPTAASEIGWKPLMKALVKGGKNGQIISRADRELIAKYSPLLWYRMQGMIDTDVGEAVKTQDWAKKMPWAFGWIEKTDVATVGRLWYAAQYYVKDHSPELTDGTDAFYRKTAEIFNRVVENTQPNYTTMQRPDILRNPNAIVKSLTMFMTQRLQNFGIIYDAYGDYAAQRLQDVKKSTEETRVNRKQAAKRLGDAVTSQAVSAIVLGIMSFMGRALLGKMEPYRDDDGEMDTESTATAIAMDAMSSVFGNIVGGSEAFNWITSTMEGKNPYDIEVAGISQINDFVQSASTLIACVHEERGTKKTNDAMMNMLLNLATLRGIPATNARNLIKGTINAAEDLQNGEFGSFNATRDYVAQNLADAAASGDDKEMDRIKAKLIAANTAKDPAATVEEDARKLLKDEYVRLYDESANKAKPLGDTIIAKLGGTEKTLEGWVKDAHLDALKAAVEGGDQTAASKALEKRRADGSKDKDTYTSLKSTFLPKMKNALAAGETDVLSGYMRTLEALWLENAKGENYFDRDKIEAMLFEEETDDED